MRIEPTEVKLRVDNVACPLCSNDMDFQLRDSMDKGLTFVCSNCNINVSIRSRE